MIMPHDSAAEAAWADRRRAQAAAFDQIGERYDEAFPTRKGR
jgi:hypothetical protein